jgi:ribosomal protein S18 acetylase RimI-like enzyme
VPGSRPRRRHAAQASSAGAVRIRPALRADQAALADIDRISWTAESGFPSVIRASAVSDTPFFNAANPPEAHLVGELDDMIAGYIRLKPPTPLPENAHVVHVSGIAVHPAARRRGVAAALLTAAESFAAASGGTKLSLRVLSTNAAAIRLYKRLGFELEGVLRGEFVIEGRPVDDVMMAKPL